ncbi:PilZ domain-containing protein [Novosphingobium aquimarinum]|uniref:PilZ domain-containing protein n=1 Tax=Novosphingobium aquimarinum TaxID=2682494 RepID=UPI001E4220B8|nr:PilZ domain-containing protein [Novosphingobium aquimarinum]
MPLASSDEPGAEQRQEPRLALLLRTAKVVSPQGEFLCIIRDVSEGGVRLRLFHLLPESFDGGLVELGNGAQFGVERVWESNGEAGFRFTQPIDLEAFMGEASPYPKRAIRLCMDVPAEIAFAGQQIPVRIHDLSRQGACIESEELLARGQVLRIKGPHLPEIEATVCWRRAPNYGLVFDRIMTMSDLAERAAAMQGALAARSSDPVQAGRNFIASPFMQ